MKFLLSYMLFVLMSLGTLSPVTNSNLRAKNHVALIKKGNHLQQLKQVLMQTQARKQKVTMRGIQHSQGGHTIPLGGTIIDMSQIHDITMVSDSVVRVQAGAIW